LKKEGIEMYVIKGSRECICYDLDDKEEPLLVELEHPGGKREEVVFKTEKVNFFVHPRAISG
jgi:hypothetical protein